MEIRNRKHPITTHKTTAQLVPTQSQPTEVHGVVDEGKVVGSNIQGDGLLKGLCVFATHPVNGMGQHFSQVYPATLGLVPLLLAVVHVLNERGFRGGL